MNVILDSDPTLKAFLVDEGLAKAGEPQRWTSLSGGVSSDIWKVETGGRTLCVKRAVEKLRVKADWQAPPERNLYEWRWFQTVARHFPGSVPTPLAFDEDRRLLAMAFLEPTSHPLWKAELLAGRVDPAFAGKVGARLGQIHSATAKEPALAAEFPTDDIFHALRLDAYLLTTGRNRPEVSGEIQALVDRTARTHVALVHGDVSPKNILMGPDGPVFLDAETAWWGDPAFDVAFCLNHLLLKRLVVPRREELNASFVNFVEGYLAHVDWEAPEALQARAASLLPGLFLARVDGKSPVEYITEEAQREAVRSVAIPLLRRPELRLDAVRAAWDRSLEA